MASDPQMYSELDSDVDSLFTKDFFSSHHVKLSSRNSSQVDFRVEGELDLTGPTSSVSISHEGENLAIDKFQLRNDGRISFNSSFKTSPQSKLFVKVNDTRQEPGKFAQSFGKLGCQVQTQSINAETDIDVVNGPILSTSMLYKYSKAISFGFNGILNTRFDEKNKTPQLMDLSVGFACRGDQGPNDWIFSCRTLESLGVLRLSYLHTLSPRLVLGSRVDYRLRGPGQTLAFGIKHKLDNASEVKVKVDSASLISTTLLHRLSPQVELKLSLETRLSLWNSTPSSFEGGQRLAIGLDLDLSK